MARKLWILEPRNMLSDIDPWWPVGNKAHAFVICAKTERAARKLAHRAGGDESRTGSPWLDPTISTCKVLKPGDKTYVVVRDFR